ncbi:MAG TPA: SHOCT domain-containing protein [Rubrobacteraceae bacterium]|jgi:hypothetical protein|nr:SHOCT domain-containing protein [Rubrobacteraceae bacterium]
MDFREREVDFQEADRRYAELARQRDAGSISDEEFDAQRQRLMIRDDEGRWWAKLGESGEWHYRDSGTWVRGIPPGYQEATHERGPVDSSPAQTPSPPSSRGVENGERRRRNRPPWELVVGLGGIALVGIVLVVWVLVPFLQGEQDPGKQGGAMLSKEEESASDGAAFDTVFVHRATPENISANSTYLDNPRTNDDPDVILYVTPNWNPGGGNGTYNEHPVGVWYDAGAQRWAIFNQDREPMPDGAAFNVAVSEQ